MTSTISLGKKCEFHIKFQTSKHEYCPNTTVFKILPKVYELKKRYCQLSEKTKPWAYVKKNDTKHYVKTFLLV